MRTAHAAFDWDRLPVLTTGRLILRSLSLTDSNDLLAIYGDEQVMQYTDEPPFPDVSYVSRMLKSMAQLFADRISIEWGIEFEGRIVGTCGLHSFDTSRANAQVGCLLARHCWGNSIMFEALTIVIAFGRTDLGISAFQADIDPANARSHALFRRLGFRTEDASSPFLELRDH